MNNPLNNNVSISLLSNILNVKNSVPIETRKVFKINKESIQHK